MIPAKRKKRFEKMSPELYRAGCHEWNVFYQFALKKIHIKMAGLLAERKFITDEMEFLHKVYEKAKKVPQ